MVSKKHIRLLLLVCSLLFLLPSLVFSYGYGGSASDDPVLLAFKNSIKAVKANDWDEVGKVIDSVSHTVSSMDKFFGFNILPELKKAVGEKNFKQVVKLLANLIYLSMMEKFEIMVEKGLNDPEYTESKLAICEIYYSGVLGGNVKSHDKKNGTSLNDEIVKSFKELKSLYKDSANLAKFKENTIKIKDNLNKAFDYFVFKR